MANVLTCRELDDRRGASYRREAGYRFREWCDVERLIQNEPWPALTMCGPR